MTQAMHDTRRGVQNEKSAILRLNEEDILQIMRIIMMIAVIVVAVEAMEAAMGAATVRTVTAHAGLIQRMTRVQAPTAALL